MEALIFPPPTGRLTIYALVSQDFSKSLPPWPPFRLKERNPNAYQTTTPAAELVGKTWSPLA